VLRQKEQSGRGIEQSYQDLMIAKNRLEPLGREIATLRTRQRAIQNDMEDLAQKQQKTDQHYRELEQGLPDLHLLEQHLQELIKLENQQRAVVGGALQMLEVIERQKERKQRITQELTKFSKQQTYIQILEKTFGRDGIQAMLIEEVLPQMEMQANDTLSRLSSGSMSVRFETERDYKDKKRDDKMQVLDILINDAEGVQRTYDLFSGGEAFRINFAIRLALSKVLAQRAGARLQLLVIDEGFGSQDAEGRQKLIEAINLIRPDFKKILVITHLEELKDAFQARIEVQKTRRGSQVEVVVQ
jgi:exonuclease SbcC